MKAIFKREVKSYFTGMIGWVVAAVSLFFLGLYYTNRNLLYEGLTGMGYTCVKPEGTFYFMMKAPEPDAEAFCRRAMERDLLLAPTDTFGLPGYVRIAFCVDTATVEKALPVFAALAAEYGR